MKTSLRFIACAAVGCLIGAASVAHGQTTWIAASGGEWNSAPNWNPATVPNATGAAAVFTGTTQVNLTSFNATTGTLTYGGTGGSLVVGTTSGTDDVLTLAVASGSPTVSATNSNATIFMYANVEGTQGLTKTGAGKFTFRFNGADQNYSGPITISGGVFGINQDGSLGNADNDVTIAHGARLTVEPGSNTGTVTLPATRTITFTSGTGQFGVSPAAVTAIVSGSVLGAGGFTSRLMQQVRSNEGLAYSVRSTIVPRVDYPGDFRAGFESKNATVALATKIVLDEIRRIRTEPVTDEELETARQGLIETFPRQFESKPQMLRVFVNDEWTQRPADFWKTFRAKVEAVTKEDLLRVAKAHLDPDAMAILVVGDWDPIAAGDIDKRASMADFFGGEVRHLPLRDPLTLEPAAPAE